MKHIGIVGSREFANYDQLRDTVAGIIEPDDDIVSGGAISSHKCPLCGSPLKSRSADFLAQRFAKEFGHDIHIYYPKYQQHGKPAPFVRNKVIVQNSDIILAFYQKGRFQEGGTSNTAKHARDLGVELREYEEDG